MILTQYISKSGRGMYQDDIPNRCQFYVNTIVEAEVRIIQAK